MSKFIVIMSFVCLCFFSLSRVWGLSPKPQLSLVTKAKIIDSFKQKAEKLFPVLHPDASDEHDYPFANDNLQRPFFALKRKKPVQTEGQNVAVVIGESAILSLLPELMTHADTIISLDINPTMQVHIKTMREALSGAESREEFYNLYFSKIKNNKTLLNSVENFFQLNKTDPKRDLESSFRCLMSLSGLGNDYFLASEERFKACKQANDKVHFVYCVIDMFNMDSVKKFKELLKNHNMHISFLNMTNISEPVYDVENKFFEIMRLLFEEDITIFCHRPPQITASILLDNIKEYPLKYIAESFPCYRVEKSNMELEYTGSHPAFIAVEDSLKKSKTDYRMTFINNNMDFLSMLPTIEKHADLLIMNYSMTPLDSHAEAMVAALCSRKVTKDTFIATYIKQFSFPEEKSKVKAMFETLPGFNQSQNTSDTEFFGALFAYFQKKSGLDNYFLSSQQQFQACKNAAKRLLLLKISCDFENQEDVKKLEKLLDKYGMTLSMLDLGTQSLDKLQDTLSLLPLDDTLIYYWDKNKSHHISKTAQLLSRHA